MDNFMNEIKQVVILAAGRSRRMENLSRRLPKCLLPYKGEQILKRLVRQIEECGIERIVISVGYRADNMHELFDGDTKVVLAENKMYEEDVNIFSMSLALSQIDGPFVIFEADTVMEDALVAYVLGSDFEGKSVWYTKGKFMEMQYGGIARSDKFGNIKDVKIVPSWQEKYKNYSKLSGLMRVGPNEIELFKALVNKYARTTLKQYYLNAWIENINLLPSIEADITQFQFFTFNKPEEYYQMQNIDVGVLRECPPVQMILLDGLIHIEEYDKERVELLHKKILERGVWTVPVVVEAKYKLILDGQHRYEAALLMNLKKVPAIVVDYENINVWSLRKEYKVSQSLVYRKIKNGNRYPYKTVKHKLGFEVPQVEIAIEELKN